MIGTHMKDKISIQTLISEHEARPNHNKYFTPSNMRLFGDTVSNFTLGRLEMIVDILGDNRWVYKLNRIKNTKRLEPSYFDANNFDIVFIEHKAV